MRYLLFVLLLILPVFAGAQTRVYVTQDQPQQIRQFRGGVDALNYFRLPVQGGHSIPAGDSLWFVRVNPGDGNVYMWDGLTWKCVSCGSGSGADSSVFATNYRLDTTRSGLEQGLNDTAAVLRDSIASLRGDIPDISGLVPQSRTITINGSTQDLSANRSWTIPVPDTSSLRADIDANSDSILVHRADIDSKEPTITPGTTADYWRGDKTWQPFPAIPDVSGLIPYSDTGNLIATTYGVDTAKQNIRDEIDNLPAPPVQSVNGQTGNVVLQFMDTAYVSGDTIYAEKGGNTFIVGVMTGGGGLDSAAVSAIVADSLTNVIRQGGNSFLPSPGNDFIGTNNNNNLNIKTNNVTRIQLINNGAININQGTSGNTGMTILANGNTSIGKNTNTGDKLEVSGASTYDGTSASTGYIARWRNSSGTVVAQFNNNNTVQFNSISGTGTGVVTADDDGVLTIERPPSSGTYTLKSIDGVIQWVED